MPCRGPRRGWKCYVTLAFLGVPNTERGEKIRSGCLTPPAWGPKRGRKCFVTPTCSGVPNAKRMEQIRRCPPHPCLLGGPEDGGNAMSSLHARGSPTPSAGRKKESGYPQCLRPTMDPTNSVSRIGPVLGHALRPCALIASPQFASIRLVSTCLTADALSYAPPETRQATTAFDLRTTLYTPRPCRQGTSKLLLGAPLRRSGKNWDLRT